MDLALATEAVPFEEVQRLHLETVMPAQPRPAPAGDQPSAPGGTGPAEPSVMDDQEIDRLLKALGDDESYKWPPIDRGGQAEERTWESVPPIGHASMDDDGGDEDPIIGGFREVQATLSGLETTVASIDDTTVEIKDRVVSAERDLDTLRGKVETLHEDVITIKEQILAVHELREEFKALRKHVSTMMRLLVDPKALGRALGIVLEPPRRAGRDVVEGAAEEPDPAT